MNTVIENAIKSYPEKARLALQDLQRLIIQAAQEHDVGPLEESLKWGEPSYNAKGGSAVRIDWKPKSPGKCFVFFQCQTRLIEVFKELYGDTFIYNGNRAIELDLSEEIPIQQLKHCIALSLTYHKQKHLPLLGA